MCICGKTFKVCTSENHEKHKSLAQRIFPRLQHLNFISVQFSKCFSLAISSQPDNVFITAKDLLGVMGNDQVIQGEPVLSQPLLQPDL